MRNGRPLQLYYEFGEYRLASGDRLLFRNGEEIRLTPTLFEILQVLLENSGHIVQKEHLLEKVWPDRFVEEGNLTRNICTLRRILQDDPENPRYIETIPRRGYRLISPVTLSEEEAPNSPGHHRPISKSVPIKLLLALGVGALAILSLFLWEGSLARGDDPGEQSVRFHVNPPPGMTYGMWDTVALSPDNKHLAFTGIREGKRLLWIRPLDSFSAFAVAGTQDAMSPFWSPDSRKIGFFVGHQLKTVDLASRVVKILCKGDGISGAWSRRGEILVTIPSFYEPGFRIVSAETGELKILKLDQMIMLDKIADGMQRPWLCTPRFLVDGNHFVFRRQGSVWISDLSSRKARVLLRNSSLAVPVNPDLMVFSRDNLMMAQFFDTASQQLAGSPVTITDDLRPTRWPFSYYDVTDENLAYRVRTARKEQLVWLDRQGRRLSAVGQPASYVQLRLSPDERKVAVTLDPNESWDTDIWLMDLDSGILSRLTNRPGQDADPVWGPTSDRIVYTTGQSIRLNEVGRSEDKQLFSRNLEAYVDDWSRDGKTLLLRGPNNRVFYLDVESRSPKSWLNSGAWVDQCQFSPDGQWIAYGSHESGNWEVYVASFPEFRHKQQISNGGGVQPVWRSDGSELFYLRYNGNVTAVPVLNLSDHLRFGRPEILFHSEVPVDPVVDQYAVTKDGQRFLVIRPVEDEEPIALVKNWRANLKF